MYNVSIIIPIYCTSLDAIEWLGECFESACSQDCYVVAVNDGSIEYKDKILEMVQRFRHYIDYSDAPHLGVSSARNTAASRVVTDLIIPLDCDDRFVKGAIKKLLSVWDGTTPVYPDIRKFGLENVAHYNLLEFECEHIYNHVGFSSVNVLHRKDQWQALRGWNTDLDFYEDGEYNARLFSVWCGKRFPEPLVEYRIHTHQRTKQYKKRSAYYARKILSMIRSLDMPCSSCGKKRVSIVSNSPAPVASPPKGANVDLLPGDLEGRILVQYIGGIGKGKHYYRGPRTKFAYKVTYGDYIYVDPADAKNTDTDTSLFVKVVQHRPAAVVQEHVRKARKDIDERVAFPIDNIAVDLPDISNMSVRDILGMDVISVEIARMLLNVEKNGKNRSKVINFLNGVLNA